MELSREDKANFTPFTLKIQTKEEAKVLWHRLNHPLSDLLREVGEDYRPIEEKGQADLMFDLVDMELIDQGIDPRELK